MRDASDAAKSHGQHKKIIGDITTLTPQMARTSCIACWWLAPRLSFLPVWIGPVGLFRMGGIRIAREQDAFAKHFAQKSIPDPLRVAVKQSGSL